MGKSKYQSIKKANKNKNNIPNFVPYKKLANYINNIDIGEVRSVHTDFGQDLPLEASGEGMYRPLVDYVQRLSKFYLTVYPKRKDNLMEFSKKLKKSPDSFLFLLCFGGDGAPGTETSFLISFLNITSRLMSSRENFMVFGANVDEKCTVVKRYIQHTVAELKHLEENVFELNIADEIVKVEYKIAELPNDMKMLCFLGDELSNSAYYFTKFANANHADCSELNKKIGKDSNDWHPFTNEQRKSSGERAAKKATELAKSKLAKSTQRNHLTNFNQRFEKSSRGCSADRQVYRSSEM